MSNEPTEEQRRQWREEAEGLRERWVQKLLGLNDLPEYHAWKDMRYRCYNPEHREFCHYGGRGIKVCDRWSDELPNHEGFWNFLADMGRRPEDVNFPRSLDRIDNDGNYEPRNCRWATASEQNSNQDNDHRRGEKNGSAKLTNDDIPVIRQLRKERYTYEAIAATFDVAVRTIRDIISGRTWSHIPDVPDEAA
jgi:hypothetical protein